MAIILSLKLQYNIKMIQIGFKRYFFFFTLQISIFWEVDLKEKIQVGLPPKISQFSKKKFSTM